MYILLLAALDCIFVLVVLLPNPVIALMYDSPAKTVLKTLRYYAATSLFTLYLNPTFYLALDRFIAVFFPHKFKVLAPKMRPLKVGLFVMQILCNGMHGVFELFLPNLAKFSLIPMVIGWLIVLTVLIASPVLYLAIFCKLMVSDRKMAGQRHTSGSPNQR